MAQGSIKITQRRCNRCTKPVKAERSSAVWGLGDFVLMLLTGGLWFVGKLLLNKAMNPWRCSVCGERV